MKFDESPEIANESMKWLSDSKKLCSTLLSFSGTFFFFVNKTSAQFCSIHILKNKPTIDNIQSLDSKYNLTCHHSMHFNVLILVEFLTQICAHLNKRNYFSWGKKSPNKTKQRKTTKTFSQINIFFSLANTLTTQESYPALFIFQYWATVPGSLYRSV